VKKEINTIFESFSQADTSTTRKYGGTGLGLSICKSLVESMNGEIWVESELNKGSEFIFTALFDEETSINEKRFFSHSNKDLNRKKVLIIDNNEIAQEILRNYCQKMGLDVLSIEESASSGLNKLQELLKNKNIPEIILSGLSIDDADVPEMIKKIKINEHLKSIKLIAITKDAKPGDAQKARKIGFHGFLPKPAAITELTPVMKMVLGDQWDENIITQHNAAENCVKGAKILVVEDSLPNQLLIQAFFDEMGCDGDYANNGQEGVDKLRSGQYDLILMDIQMPIMSGLEATEIIRRKIDKDIPIIALTAAVMEEDQEKTKIAGMNDFLAKPVDINQLRDKILQYYAI